MKWSARNRRCFIQRCNELWMVQTPEEAAAAAAAAAVPNMQSLFRNSRRFPSPFRRKTPGGDNGCCRSPNPGAAKGGRSDSLCFYHSRFGNKAHKCEKCCSYQEN